MPHVINRGKAVAQIVTASHREEIMNSKRERAATILLKIQEQKKLKKDNKKA